MYSNILPKFLAIFVCIVARMNNTNLNKARQFANAYSDDVDYS